MLAGNWKTSRIVAHYSAGATAERAGQVDVENIEVELAHLVQELGGLRVSHAVGHPLAPGAVLLLQAGGDACESYSSGGDSATR